MYEKMNFLNISINKVTDTNRCWGKKTPAVQDDQWSHLQVHQSSVSIEVVGFKIKLN